MRIVYLTALVLAFGALSACTTWTSVHAGYGKALASDRSLVGVELRRAIGLGFHSGYALAGLRVDSNDRQFDVEGHLGAMAPLRLAEAWTLTPSATIELGRASRIDRRWYGGALGPGLGAELSWWFLRQATPHSSGPMFGCMGGAIGMDCPRVCRFETSYRTGLGLRVAAEYDARFGAPGPHGAGDSIVWVTLGLTHAVTPRENECCSYDNEPLFQNRCAARP
jgi:hypothetical protein